ncbi:MAG: pseudouridine synthase [Candidatus Neomarinimicrobiota bacterium]
MRLNKFIAASGVASRRKSEEIVKAGRVEVNGIPVTNPYRLLRSDDVVSVDNRTVSPPGDSTVIVLNKPTGVITTVKDTHGRPTVMNLVEAGERLFPVGRLDKNTTGTLLLTNDGDLAHRIVHPRFQVEKVYVATIDRPWDEADTRRIESGVEMGGSEIGMAKVLSRDTISGDGKKRVTSRVRLSLSHGKKREVRRILKRLGYRVIALHRESFGGIGVEGLAPGEWRKLKGDEIAQLTGTVKHKRL